MINTKLLKRLALHRFYSDQDQHLKYKVAFLNSVFLMAALVAFGMGFYRWQQSPLMGAIDFAFSAISAALLYHLRYHNDKVEFISTVAIVLAFGLFLAIYLLAPYNTMRLSLFFLLSAAAFYLKGRKAGLTWLLVIVATIAVVHFLSGINTGYSNIDIITTCLYLIALFLIFWNYETIREDQLKREQENQLQSLIDERWRLALESAGDAIWDWNIRTGVLISSKLYAVMLGYGEGEIGQDAGQVESLLHADDRDKASRHLRAYLSGDFSAQYSSEQRMMCKDGSYRWILCRGRVTQRDEFGRAMRMVGTHVDITEHKRIEATLKDSETRLHLALEASNMGVWEYDLKTEKLFWSPEVYRVFELDYFEPTLELFQKEIHIEDATRVRSAMEKAISQRSLFLVEFRYRVRGAYRWIEDRGEVQYDENGVPQRVIGTVQDISERKEHENQLQRIAHYDALTGVPNRVLLADRLSQALARAKREKGLMAVCYLDLDGFKPVNDNFGHEAGDKVLVEVTRRIKETIREDDTVARLGGDEFVVLLVGLQAPEECAGSLARLLEIINSPIDIQGKLIHISVSIGVSLYPEDEQDADTLLRHADQAMYIAKQTGRNRYHLYDAANDLRARSHHELLQQMRRGLEQGDFELYFQPQVEMSSRRMVGVEALIRWHHPQRGLLLPNEFLRAIENTELEIELGDWVVTRAYRQMRQWRDAGHDFEVSINISAYHLQSSDFVPKLRSLVQNCCVQPCHRCLKIEVLETAALDDIEAVSAIIKACREFGVGFALDDFGTGYSSLTYLSNLDVDTLKIDQSFVRDMLEEKGDHAIVLGIIALAKAFDRSIVAEGVENEAHYAALLQMGCEVGQGFGIAPPMPAAELIQWKNSSSL